MTRPFEGIRIIDITHVLAGPFATYQLGLLGADVIKVEHPGEPDQSRHFGADRTLNHNNMGLAFLTQGSNKRAITLDLKTEQGREVLKRLVKTADVLVENYRAGAFKALGIGYDDLKAINARLIYCSMTAFGQDGPRGGQTAYDQVIQALAGLTASTGTSESGPVKFGTQAVDYATGVVCAFALSAALFQREKTGQGQHIDASMLDVALILASAHITNHSRTGKDPGRRGNCDRLATYGCYEAADGLIQLAAGNTRQHKRLFDALGMPERGGKSYDEREDHREQEAVLLRDILKTKTAQEWEDFLQSKHVPAGRVRALSEALVDPQLESRNIVHRHEDAPGVDGAFTVPIAAFTFAHGGPRVDSPPPQLGQHNDEVLGELDYSTQEIAAMRTDGVI